MSSESKARSTHTSDAFVDFAYDLLEYALPKYGYIWNKPSDYQRNCTKLFREGFGDMVMLFRSRNSQDFYQLLTLVAEMENTDDILLYVARFRDRIFKGNIPLMEIISYFSFLLDIALICFQIEDPDLLYNIVDDTVEVFHKYIKSYFTIIGGWFALYRIAKQYMMYITFEPQSDPAVSVAKDFVPEESGYLSKI